MIQLLGTLHPGSSIRAKSDTVPLVGIKSRAVVVPSSCGQHVSFASRHPPARTDSIVPKGVVLDQFKVVADTDHGTRVAGQRHDSQRSEHGVDGAAFESELAQMRACEECVRRVEERRRRGRDFALRPQPTL